MTNCPRKSHSDGRRDSLRERPGIGTEQVVGDEVHRGRFALVGDRRPGPGEPAAALVERLRAPAAAPVRAARRRRFRARRTGAAVPAGGPSRRRRRIDGSTAPLTTKTAFCARNARVANERTASNEIASISLGVPSARIVLRAAREQLGEDARRARSSADRSWRTARRSRRRASRVLKPVVRDAPARNRRRVIACTSRAAASDGTSAEIATEFP